MSLALNRDQRLRNVIVEVAHRGPCNICQSRTAAYDALLKRGQWAYVCQNCFTRECIGLGLGVGQRMFTDEEQVEYDIWVAEFLAGRIPTRNPA